MKKTHNAIVIPEISRGERIRAAWLSGVARAVNANTRFLSGPRQQNALLDTEQQNTGSSDLRFVEISRASTAETLTDSGGDTSPVSVIDEIRLQNSSGEVLELVLTNP